MLHALLAYPDYAYDWWSRAPSSWKPPPIVKRFEGQTVGALTSWAQARFGGPIIVQKVPQVPRENER